MDVCVQWTRVVLGFVFGFIWVILVKSRLGANAMDLPSGPVTWRFLTWPVLVTLCLGAYAMNLTSGPVTWRCECWTYLNVCLDLQNSCLETIVPASGRDTRLTLAAACSSWLLLRLPGLTCTPGTVVAQRTHVRSLVQLSSPLFSVLSRGFLPVTQLCGQTLDGPSCEYAAGHAAGHILATWFPEETMPMPAGIAVVSMGHTVTMSCLQPHDCIHGRAGECSVERD